MNIVIFSFLSLIYVVVISYTILKVIDIIKNPKKYEDRELVRKTEIIYANKKYDFCRFFKSLSHQYSMVTFLFIIILTIIGILIILAINRLYAGNNGYIFQGSSLSGGLALLFLCMPIGMGMIPLAMKKPFFVITTLDLFNTEYRPKIFKKTYFWFLIIFIIAWPFIVLSCNNYGYYTNDGVYINKYFQVDETYVPYNEISKVEIYVSHNNKDEINSLNYILYLNNNIKFNINSQNTETKVFKDCVLAIHEYLLDINSCEFIVTPLTERDLEIYKQNVTEEEYQNILKIFQVNEASQ